MESSSFTEDIQEWLKSDPLITTHDYSWTTVDMEKNIFIQNYFPVCALVASYLGFVLLLGPRLMRKRKAFDLWLPLVIYNISLSVINCYAGYHEVKVVLDFWPNRCNTDFLWTLKDQYQWLAWISIFSRMAELFDTVFFVLRKRFHQITFMHVYHHTAAFSLLWMACKFHVGGFYMLVLGIMMYSIHCLLYMYFAMSVVAPEVRTKFPWCKKYLTAMEIGQFFVVMIYMCISYMSGCEVISLYDIMFFFVLILITSLFMKFYSRTYTKRE